jgi:hypothetical protein
MRKEHYFAVVSNITHLVSSACEWKRLWIIFVITLAAGGTSAQELEARLTQRADFIPAEGTMREQLIQVAQHYKIPMGIEWVLQPKEKQVKLGVREAPTVMALLELILQSAPEYSLTVRRGVVSVSNSRYTVDSRNFLNIRIDEFSLKKANVFDAEAELRFKIRATLHPELYANGMNGGYGYGVPDENGFDVKTISFSGEDLTVRDILDRIVSANGNSLWMVNIVPSRMMKDEPFFAQFDNDEPASFIWRILPFRKSTQP